MRTIRNCSIAVPGGAGFLGSHLVDHLLDDRDCRVLVLDDLSSGRKEFVHPRAILKVLDLTTATEEELVNLFALYDVRFVMNYSAQPFVPDSYNHPLKVFSINAMAALKIINAAHTAGCEGILQVSSAEVYGEAGVLSRTDADDPHKGKLTEDHPVTPHSSYGASKAAIDALVQVRWKEAGTKVMALRQFNCCGERDCTHAYVVPEIIKQMRATGPRLKLGNDSTRDFMYAGDAVRLAVELLENGEWGGVYNLGSEESISIYNLAQKISDIMGCGRVTIERDPTRVRAYEIWHLQSDNTKLMKVLRQGGQLPILTTLHEALMLTIGWFEQRGWKDLP